jgi:tripartite ATP-independent transporter DctP family solute receptor
MPVSYESRRRKNMKKIISILLVLTMVFALAGCGGGGTEPEAEDTILIRIGHTDSSTRSTNTAGLWLAEYLAEETDGRVVVEMYPDGQAGDDPDMAAGVKLGTIEFYFGLASVISAIAGDEASCVDLPYLYPTYEDWITGTFENGGLELFNEALAEAGYTAVDMLYNGMRNVISRDKVYHNSEDFNGTKIRISQNELNVTLWQAMGANPTPMAWGEVVTSLSQGTIDALDHSLGVFNDFSLYEMAPYVTITNHCSSPYPLVCSTEWLESLPEDLKPIILDGIHQMCEMQRAEERANEMEYLASFEAAGATIYELTAEESAAFKELCKPAYDLWAEKVGQDLIDAWLATCPE